MYQLATDQVLAAPDNVICTASELLPCGFFHGVGGFRVPLPSLRLDPLLCKKLLVGAPQNPKI